MLACSVAVVPATAWEGVRRSDLQDQALGGAHHLDRAAAMGGDDGVDLVVGAGPVVVKEDEFAGARGHSQSDGVLDRGVAEVADAESSAAMCWASCTATSTRRPGP